LMDILDPPARLGGWILLGFMEEWLRDPRNTPDEVVPRPMVPHGAPGWRMIVPMKVIVETLVYTLAQDAYPPMVLPLVWDLYNGEIELSFDQPIAMQVIGAYNKYKKNCFRKLATFELFDVKLGKFRPASVHRAPGSTSFRLPLPLTYIPVFKDSTLTIVEDAAEHSLGIQPLKPMCSMKRNIMDLEFLWPVDMPQRRQLIRADWHVEGQWWGSQRRLAAVRPVLGEVGCTVEEVKLLSDCRSDLAPFSQDIRKCVDVEFELVGLSCVRQIWNTDWTYQTARQGRSSFPLLAAQSTCQVLVQSVGREEARRVVLKASSKPVGARVRKGVQVVRLQRQQSGRTHTASLQTGRVEGRVSIHNRAAGQSTLQTEWPDSGPTTLNVPAGIKSFHCKRTGRSEIYLVQDGFSSLNKLTPQQAGRAGVVLLQTVRPVTVPWGY
ncbi:uncharacterized protein B0H18DRAFT_964994, partial [Fomitopsis serialis]|uniref:uncharacterized protein n=1 Tax=Fomitopsis serialis TaxID=139415 RepID=UPI00200851B9